MNVEDVRSNSPMTTATYAFSGGSGTAQTMKTASLSPFIQASSVIRACKSALIGKCGSGGGCDADVLIDALNGIADEYYQSTFAFTP